MLTEAQAKSKWCPMMRITPRVPPLTRLRWWLTGKRTPADWNMPGCVGNQCALWRWFDDKVQVPIYISGKSETDKDFARRRDDAQARRTGYCGLGQKPRHAAIG